jgi:D-alanyl-D-alanine carboxypeptidase
MSRSPRVRLLVSCAVAVACTAFAAPVHADDASSAAFPPSVTSQLDGLLHHLTGLHVPGVVLGVDVAGQGTYLSASGQVGLSDSTPIATDSHLRIGSITKTFVATVILQLAGECRLSLDDTLDKWQPSVTDASNITVRELLQHTSGIPDYQGTEPFVHQLLTDPFFVWNHQDLVGLIAGKPLLFTPGTQWSYSNTNYLLLGLIAEAVTGQHLEDLVRTRIIEPLGLTGTSFPTTAEIPAPRTNGTEVILDQTTLALLHEQEFDFNPSGVWAAGAMISTVPDLMVWAKAFATGQLLPAAMLQEQLQFVPTNDTFAPFDAFPGPTLSVDYGLGMMSAGGAVGHDGEVPGWEAIMVYDPSTGTTIVEAQNASVDLGEPQEPVKDDLTVELPSLTLPSVLGILGQAAGSDPTAPAAPPLACGVPVLIPAFTA